MNKSKIFTVFAVVCAIVIAFIVGRKNAYEKNIKENWLYHLATVKNVSLEEETKDLLCMPEYNYNWSVTYTYEGKNYTQIIEEKHSKVKDRNTFENEYVPIYINPDNPEEVKAFSFDIEVVSE